MTKFKKIWKRKEEIQMLKMLIGLKLHLPCCRVFCSALVVVMYIHIHMESLILAKNYIIISAGQKGMVKQFVKDV